MTRRPRPRKPDEPSTGALKVSLARALGELFARADVDRFGRKRFGASVLAYALRVIDRYGTDHRFFESIETSARILRINEKTARLARAELIRLGILVEIGKRHGPGRSRVFEIRCPGELVAAAFAREKATPEAASAGIDMPSDSGPDGSPHRGHAPPEQRACTARTEGIDLSDGGHSHALQTSEPLNLKEPAEQRTNGVAIAAAFAPVARGATRGTPAHKAKRAQLAAAQAEAERVWLDEQEERRRREAAGGKHD